MPDHLTDPILGTLLPRPMAADYSGVPWHVGTVWVSRLWFTPKHPIEVIFDQFHAEADDVLEQLARASEAYAALRLREWEYRLEAARELDEEVDGDWDGNDGPETEPLALARQLRLVRVELWGDRSAALVYRGPEPWVGYDLGVGLDSDGSYDGVSVFRSRPTAGGGDE